MSRVRRVDPVTYFFITISRLFILIGVLFTLIFGKRVGRILLGLPLIWLGIFMFITFTGPDAAAYGVNNNDTALKLLIGYATPLLLVIGGILVVIFGLRRLLPEDEVNPLVSIAHITFGGLFIGLGVYLLVNNALALLFKDMPSTSSTLIIYGIRGMLLLGGGLMVLSGILDLIAGRSIGYLSIQDEPQVAGCLILCIFLILMFTFSGGWNFIYSSITNPYNPQATSTAEAVDQQHLLSDNADIPNLHDPGSPYSPYLKGKVIIIDKPDKKFDTSVLGASDPLLATTSAEVGTVIWVNCTSEDTQYSYDNIHPATWWHCDMTIIDKAKATVVGSKHFDGEYPPEVLQYGGNCCGRPDSDMTQYIQSLPKK